MDQPTTSWGFPNPATPPGSSTYYAIRFADVAQRDALAALCGWRHLVRSVLEQVSDPGVAARKLAWWQGELERIFARQGQHPLAPALSRAMTRADLPRQPFLDILWAVEALLANRQSRDQAEVLARAELDCGSLAELMLHQTPGHVAAQRSAARRAGAYWGLVALIRDSGWLLRRGRLGVLPADALARQGIAQWSPSGPLPGAALASVLAELLPLCHRERERLDPDLASLPSALRIRVRLADTLLAELMASGLAVADQRIALTPLRKLWIAWRESRARVPQPIA
ncbi:squalene/phytoene synthase family protein [Thiocapsa imhoffii]|uniref:squalene/phytoene synthase family protein n=1 Tax=Thiocapsa imhoffii TaxID=382777 RepID=UPI001903C1F4